LITALSRRCYEATGDEAPQSIDHDLKPVGIAGQIVFGNLLYRNLSPSSGGCEVEELGKDREIPDRPFCGYFFTYGRRRSARVNMHFKIS
jgi:hypothetical protein